LVLTKKARVGDVVRRDVGVLVDMILTARRA